MASFFGTNDPSGLRPGFFDRPGNPEMMLALGAGLAQAAYPAQGQSGWSMAPQAVLQALQARQFGARSQMEAALYAQKIDEAEREKKARESLSKALLPPVPGLPWTEGGPLAGIDPKRREMASFLADTDPKAAVGLLSQPDPVAQARAMESIYMGGRGSPEFQGQVSAAQAQAQNPALLQRKAGEAALELQTKPQLASKVAEAELPSKMALAKATEESKEGGKTFTSEKKLRDEFLKQSGEFTTVRDAYGRIQASLEKPSAAGDLALLYAYNKMLDPGSVVRESEFATVAASGSLGERMQGMVSRIVNGERLTPSQRDDLAERAGMLFRQQERLHKGTETRYRTLAEQYQLDPEKVVGDLSAGLPKAGENPYRAMSNDEILRLLRERGVR